eukprot:TRINITY_DN8565_c0_g1_i1.p1 TRINITY_DN8565_c0_g1~~TRINITY_DN8565_c0_g1_i1.p1  ORF type:complete len:152 (+),score=22.93 TRINITY_DN8565_c0_g1_i1:87-542(+)
MIRGYYPNENSDPFDNAKKAFNKAKQQATMIQNSRIVILNVNKKIDLTNWLSNTEVNSIKKGVIDGCQVCIESVNTYKYPKQNDIVVANHASLESCLLYTSDAADEEDSVDLGGRRIIKKKKREERMKRNADDNTISKEKRRVFAQKCCAS